METKPTQHAHHSKDRATKAEGSVQQKCRVQTGFRQGQTLVCYTICVVVSPVWAHDSEAPWPVVVPEAWHRFRGQTRQGGRHLLAVEDKVPRCRSRVLSVRASGPSPDPSWVGMRPRRPLQDVREVRGK